MIINMQPLKGILFLLHWIYEVSKPIPITPKLTEQNTWMATSDSQNWEGFDNKRFNNYYHDLLDKNIFVL